MKPHHNHNSNNEHPNKNGMKNIFSRQTTLQIEYIITDTFQEEITREVTPSTSGLLKKKKVPQKGKLVLGHKVRHKVAIPSNYAYIPISQHIRSSEPARTYPFKLDPFQEHAISCIERSESVFVNAHTSAGKKVVAEYAIAQSLKNKQRVIYTTPFKELSNQKYRNLQHEFKDDVGLMTGNVTLNRNSSCIVMTTDILHGMLYRRSEILREVAWVIFDEINYMQDKDYGFVLEETIMLLPHNIHTVFLSTIIRNAMGFAEWICKIHHQPCHVVYTDFRPTPLQHYIYINDPNKISLLVDEKGTFYEDALQESILSIREKKSKNSVNSKFNAGLINVHSIIKACINANLDPIIAFVFSKKKCENLAMQLSQMDFNNDDEKELIANVIDNAIDLLAEEDRQLQSIHDLLPLLKRGIGIHHQGLLPFLKEVVELLFQEGLIKVLFATETFSMGGLNKPAKTVVFCELAKFNGSSNVLLKSDEYIQMSDHAGRRGLDDCGHVIMTLGSDNHLIKNMVMGKPDGLLSAFQLKYHMILNMSIVEGLSPEYMLQNSFYQFQKTIPISRLQTELKRVQEKIGKDNEDSVAQYCSFVKLKEEMIDEFNEYIINPEHCLRFLTLGRLVWVKYDDMDFGWNIIIKCEEVTRSNARYNLRNYGITIYKVKVLLRCSHGSFVRDGEINITPCPVDLNGVMLVVPIELKNIQKISQIRLHTNENIEHEHNLMDSAYETINNILLEHPTGVPLDPIAHMDIKIERFKFLYHKKRLIEENINRHPINQDPLIIEKCAKKLSLVEHCKNLKSNICKAKSILRSDELKKRKCLLRRMGYLSENNVIEFKGRIACEIRSGDEIVLTELLFNGVFNGLSAEMTAALLSCFIIDENPYKSNTTLQEEFIEPYNQILETAKIVAEITAECNITIDKRKYIANFSSGLMESVYAWCNHATFSETCKKACMPEGNVARSFKSLDILLQEMVLAAKCIGSIELENKFSSSIEKIKRGIIFAASLYH